MKLLVEAEGMASGNQNTLALVQGLKGRAAVKTKGALVGSRGGNGLVPARGTKTYVVAFQGGNYFEARER